MNTTASTGSTGHALIARPAVEHGGIAPRKGSDWAPESTRERRHEEQEQRVNGTVLRAEQAGLGWSIATGGSGGETKTTREILDTIDADTLRAARIRGGAKAQIGVNRERIGALLELRKEWKQPDEVYADEAWEISIIWRSEYGRVEIGTEEDGRVGYYISRTLREENEEGIFEDRTREELDRVMSWLDRVRKET